MLVYIVIVFVLCFSAQRLRRRRFISTVLLLLLFIKRNIIDHYIIDLGPPVVTGCPADVKATTELGTPTTTVTWTEPTATDEGTFTTVRSHVPGESFPVGTTHVAYIYTDRPGKTSACSFSVIVETGL